MACTPTASLTNEVRGGWQGSDPIFDNTIPDPNYFIQVPLINNTETAFQAQGRQTDILNFQDNAVWLRGNHSFRFGGQYDIFKADPLVPVRSVRRSFQITCWAVGPHRYFPSALSIPLRVVLHPARMPETIALAL